VLRPADIAAELGFSRSRVYQLIASGMLPGTRRGRSIWIPRAAWEKWLAGQAEAAMRGVQDQEAGDRGGDPAAA
jgi:excisionase family DNA binding protein